MDINQDMAWLRINQGKLAQKSLEKLKENHADDKKFNRQLKKAADGFEELFIHKMLQVMRNSVNKSNLLHGGRGEEIFQDMLDENYAKLITQSKAFGLSNLIFEQLKKP